ncbi:hypothetical protein BG452_07620 [Streptomyces sp. CBMA123]|nr:hypothetical protein [Streptomyces sp. CBMA123]
MVRLHLDAQVIAVQTGLRAFRATLLGAPRRADDTETIDAYVREQAWVEAVREQVRLVEDALAARRAGRNHFARHLANGL